MFTLLNDQKMTRVQYFKLFAENLSLLHIYKIAFALVHIQSYCITFSCVTRETTAFGVIGWKPSKMLTL